MLSIWQRKTGMFVSWGLFVSAMAICLQQEYVFHFFHDVCLDGFVLVLPVACICSAKVGKTFGGVIGKVPSAEFLSYQDVHQRGCHESGKAKAFVISSCLDLSFSIFCWNAVTLPCAVMLYKL